MFNLSKPRCEELSMCFRRYDKQGTGLLDYKSLINLLFNIGIHLSHNEKQVLQKEFEERGGFTLGDLLTLGETFYNNQSMKTQIEKSLGLICDGKTVETKLLFNTLIKLGTKIKLEEELLRRFLFDYCQAGEYINIETFGVEGMIITVLYLLFNSSSSIRVDRHAFITSGDFYRGLYSNLTTRIIDREKPIMVVLNFKCYLNNDDFDRVAQSIGQLIPSPNVKLLISPPNIHLHKFRNSSSNNYKYELCSQNMSTFRGFGAYTGEITAEMLKDIGVNWCLIGHPETGLNTEMQNGEEEYSENVKKMINSIETNITPILILLGNGNTKCKDNDDCMKHTCKCTCMCKNINVENEISMLVKKLDKYCSMLRERYPSRDLHINVAYESKESIGSGVPVNPGIVKQIVEGLQYWCSEVSQHGVNINVLYGGSLNADIAKDYVDAGCDGLLFGKYSIKADMQKLIDNLR